MLGEPIMLKNQKTCGFDDKSKLSKTTEVFWIPTELGTSSAALAAFRTAPAGERASQVRQASCIDCSISGIDQRANQPI